MKKAKDLCIKFNKGKFQFKVNKVKFLDHKVTKNGINCDPDRVKPIGEINAPKDKKDLQRILGLINFFLTHAFPFLL